MKSKLFGVLLLIETAALLLTAAVALHYQHVSGETDAQSFLLTAGLTGAVGLLLYNIGNTAKKSQLQIRDSFMVVGSCGVPVSWGLLFSCGVPFWHEAASNSIIAASRWRVVFIGLCIFGGKGTIFFLV